MRRPLIIRLALVVLLSLVSGMGMYLRAQQRGVPVTVTACLQYQKVKSRDGDMSRLFRNYGMRPMMFNDSTRRLWGYHVRLDSVWTDKQPLYRVFQKHDIYSFAVIDGRQPNSSCQYVFWWKGYYRRFADDLKRMGFAMCNDKHHTNILRFSRDDIDVIVDFIIWDDIYVMQLSLK